MQALLAKAEFTFPMEFGECFIRRDALLLVPTEDFCVPAHDAKTKI